MKLVDRFLKYVTIDTQSDPNSKSVPTTKKQVDFAEILVEDMKAMGIQDVFVNEFGIVYGCIPSNASANESIGFISHMDTSSDMSGQHVKPRIVSSYDGKDILLNDALGISMNPKMFPTLLSCIGEDIIVTDGTTLLGCDDKAGIVEILDMCKYVLEHPEIMHKTIKIAFTPDEEVGRGADHFDVSFFGADYAYTVDGSDIHSLDYESFNAASASIEIQGVSIHPGEAKDKMINASLVAMQLDSLLNQDSIPSKTQGYEGFHHLLEIHGSCERSVMHYIIRDHDEAHFEKKKQEFQDVATIINKQYGDIVTLTMEDSYYNMAKPILEHPNIVSNAKDAMKRIGLKGISTPIRGGTDGSKLSFLGLPCPNIGTGGANFHGKYEYVSIQAMHKISALLVELIKVEEECLKAS